MTKSLHRALLDRILPNRTKRLVLISALIGTLKEKEEVDERYLQILNSRIPLSDNPAAMKLPIKINRAIWPREIVAAGFKAIQNEDQEEAIRSFAEKLFHIAPSFLRYTNESAIIDDLAKVLRFEVSVGCVI